ncbi:MAG: response regulator [Chloroflexota bacterium]
MSTDGRILIVEDQREWQIEIKHLLKDFPYAIKIANGFQKAHDYLTHHVFNLVLLDLRLNDWEEGNFDGWNLIQMIAQARKEQGTQVIIISAYGDTEIVREGFKEYSLCDYLDKKRFTPIEFQEAVIGAIEKAFFERKEIIDTL